MSHDVYVCTIKKSLKRSTWQIKDSASHELVLMHGLWRQLDAAVVAAGGDPSDPQLVWDFIYSPKAMEKFTFRLELIEDRVGRVVYRVALGPETTPGTEGWLPSRIFTPWGTTPTRLWIRIEPIRVPRPIFLSPYTEPDVPSTGAPT